MTLSDIAESFTIQPSTSPLSFSCPKKLSIHSLNGKWNENGTLYIRYVPFQKYRIHDVIKYFPKQTIRLWYWMCTARRREDPEGTVVIAEWRNCTGDTNARKAQKHQWQWRLREVSRTGCAAFRLHRENRTLFTTNITGPCGVLTRQIACSHQLKSLVKQRWGEQEAAIPRCDSVYTGTGKNQRWLLFSSWVWI